MSRPNTPDSSFDLEIPETPDAYLGHSEGNQMELDNNVQMQDVDAEISDSAHPDNAYLSEDSDSSSTHRTSIGDYIADIQTQVPSAAGIDLQKLNLTFEYLDKPLKNCLPLRLHMGTTRTDHVKQVWMHMRQDADARHPFYSGDELSTAERVRDLNKIDLNPELKPLKGKAGSEYHAFIYFSRYCFLLKCAEMNLAHVTVERVPIHESLRRDLIRFIRSHSEHLAISNEFIEIITEDVLFRSQTAQEVSHVESSPILGINRKTNTNDAPYSPPETHESEDDSMAVPSETSLLRETAQAESLSCTTDQKSSRIL